MYGRNGLTVPRRKQRRKAAQSGLRKAERPCSRLTSRDIEPAADLAICAGER
jgi:hypothetical protein